MAALPAGVKVADRIAVPGGGEIVIGDDGAVYALGGAAYYGGLNNMKGDTLAGKHQFGQGALSLNPTGGYSIRDTEGRQYNLDTAYARGAGFQVPDQGNTLNADPAMLAFLRTSGLSLETAANQVRQQTAALQAAKDVSLGDINNQYGEQSRRTHGGFESRGVSRGSSHQQAQDQNERQRLAATTSKQNEVAGQVGSLNTGLVNQVLSQQQKAAELGLSTGQSQDYADTLNQIKRKYAPELAAGGLSG